MRLAGAALNQTPLDWAPNLANIRTALDQARAAGVELLCLPELCLTGYGCEDLFLHPWVADAGAWDVFVAKLTPTGAWQWATGAGAVGLTMATV